MLEKYVLPPCRSQEHPLRIGKGGKMLRRTAPRRVVMLISSRDLWTEVIINRMKIICTL